MINSILLSCILCVNLSWIVISRELQNEEYCNSEVFTPSCNDGEIIVILEAHFGRKQVGRCLKDEEGLTEANLKDERYIGCYNDIKANLASKCSGKISCEVRVAELSSPKSCYNYLKSYLGVVYRCIKMAQSDKNCVISLNDHPQYLPLGLLALKTDCGSHFKPWIAETLKGQKILAVLEDFSIPERNRTIQKTNWYQLGNCNDKFGFIAERTENRNITICMNEGNSNSQLFKFLSTSNIIDVVTSRDAKDRILALKLEVMGCSDLIPPADAWLKRTENEATIGCYSTRLRWQLKCLGQRWIGVIGNCSYGHVIIHNVETEIENEKPTNQIVIVFMIVVAGLVMCLLIGCLGLVCLKRYYAISKLKGLKQMNALVDNFQPVYDKDRLNKDPSSFGANFGGTLSNGKALNGSIGNPDNAQYFELDQSIVNKELLN